MSYVITRPLQSGTKEHTVTSWVNVVLLLCVQQQYKCSYELGYALMLLVEVNGGLSREKGGGTT